MDTATVDYYARSAPSVSRLYESIPSPLAAFFGAAFPPGSRVVDIGAGSGRDLAELVGLGYDAYGIEPVGELLEQARAIHPALADRLVPGALPVLGAPFDGQFDGVLCNAVLMHIPEADLFDAAFALRRVLRSHGRLLVSLPLTRNDVASDERTPDGRLFKLYRPEYLQLLFERIGFQQIGRWDRDDAFGRGNRWYTLLFELRAGGLLRAVDQIEGILNRDKKVATYKLALFRALAELATQEPRYATWRVDGQVGVPIRRIAEKWLAYYWPIFASVRFVPQSQAEGAGPNNPVAFRESMLALMAAYRSSGEHGGLSAWQLELSSGRLPPQRQKQFAIVIRAIARTIRLGPVQYAGGALESGTVFSYDKAESHVVMSAELWRELSLLGHWITDAVVVRWAELTERFAQRQGIRSGDVLPLLLARPEPGRATHLARQVFLKHDVDRCAWSDRPLAGDFAVDHIIPFSLWGNNDLWNLLPVHPKINAEKSDKLPTAELILERRPSIVDRWKLLREELPEAFDLQAGHLLGRPISGPIRWDEELLTRLRQAIELTALQRGVERWEPGRRRERPAKVVR